MTLLLSLEQALLGKFSKLVIETIPVGQTCEFMKGTGKNLVKCGRKSEFQFEEKWYCGKQKDNGEFSMHMGTISKSLGKKKNNKINKAMSKKIADEQTQDLINQITKATVHKPRRAWKGGPYIYDNGVFGSPQIVINATTQTAEGVLVNVTTQTAEGEKVTKEILPLNAEAIKICRALKITYELLDDEGEVDEEDISDNDGSDDEEGEGDKLETSEDEEYNEEDDDGSDGSDGSDDDDDE